MKKIFIVFSIVFVFFSCLFAGMIFYTQRNNLSGGGDYSEESHETENDLDARVSSSYTVTFNANGGTVSQTSKTVTYNSQYGTLPTASRTYYEHGGWWTSLNGGTRIYDTTTYTIAGNQVLYAHWIPIVRRHHVYFKLIKQNGEILDSNIGGSVNLQWYLAELNSEGKSIYKEIEIFDSDALNVHQGQAFTMTANPKSGYEFVGFSTDKSPSDEIKNPSTMPRTTETYYPTESTNFYVYFKQLSENLLKYDMTDKFFFFEDGYYPQSRVTNEETLNSSATATGETIKYNNGRDDVQIPIYAYANNKYAKVTVRGETKWFKFEPIRWRISDYGVEKTERNISKYKTLLKFKKYASYSDNFVAVSDLILGVGAMNNTREVNEGVSVDEMTSFVNLKNFTINDMTSEYTQGFKYNRTGNIINIDSYSGYGNGQTNVINKNNSIVYSEALRACSLAELNTVGFVNRGAKASDMVAFILGQDKNNVSYWTRDLSNLGAGVAITPTGTQIRPWLDEVLGMRFAYNFREGSYGNVDYELINYIESTGTQYIDTGLRLSNNTNVELKASTNVPNVDMALFGCRDNTSNNRWVIWHNASNGTLSTSVHYGSSSNHGSQVSGRLGIAGQITIDNGVVKYDNNQILDYSTTTAFTTSYNAILFGMSTGGVVDSRLFRGKLYSCRIWDNGVLVRDFVPVRNIYTGEVGLFDIVTEKFYGNAGTGEFLSGKIGYENLSYIESTGTQYIDTGFVPDKNTKIEVDVAFTSANGIYAVYGAAGPQQKRFWMGRAASANYYCYAYYGSNYSILNSWDESEWFKRHTYSHDRNRTSDGTNVMDFAEENFSCEWSMLLLAAYHTETTTKQIEYQTPAKFYGAKIWDDGVLVRDFVPVRNVSTGEIGLWDNVTGMFFGNAGTGTFIAG